MKKLIATLCITGSALALNACHATTDHGYVDTAPPYSQARTAGYDSPAPAAPKKAERVFRDVQTK